MAAVQRCTSQRRSSLRCNIHCTVMGLSFFSHRYMRKGQKGMVPTHFPRVGVVHSKGLISTS